MGHTALSQTPKELVIPIPDVEQFTTTLVMEVQMFCPLPFAQSAQLFSLASIRVFIRRVRIKGKGQESTFIKELAGRQKKKNI